MARIRKIEVSNFRYIKNLTWFPSHGLNCLVGPCNCGKSTLLLEGLEADVAVILDASELDARNLYVAMTRAARCLVICGPKPVLCG
jgi:predicted ATP-dependent endonuclease of OLD family